MFTVPVTVTVSGPAYVNPGSDHELPKVIETLSPPTNVIGKKTESPAFIATTAPSSDIAFAVPVNTNSCSFTKPPDDFL